MSVRADGIRRCDRCGADVGNGSVIESVTISDLARDGQGRIEVGAPLILDLCRANNCDTRVLTSRALADFRENSA